MDFDDLNKIINDYKMNFNQVINSIRNSEIYKSIESLDSQLSDMSSNLNKIAKDLIAQYNFDDITNQFKKHFSELPNLVEQFKKSADFIKDGIKVMAEHGWYFDMELPISSPLEISKILNSKNKEEVNTALIAYFRENQERILTNTLQVFPNRKAIISKAFQAHNNEDYELSIPVLLTQIDGICVEVFSGEIFMNRNKKPKTAGFVESLNTINTWRSAIFHVLLEPSPISWSEPIRRENEFYGLNRHMVLHGESLDYGTEENSLKVISLLNYVVQCHQRIIEENCKNKSEV